MFHCENCGKKFKTAAIAQHAIDSGCPKCSGSDIYPSDQEPYTCPQCGGSERYSDSDCPCCGALVQS
jgi:predicted RNA-binding Zn-ribbon protein involved in translation (DUF1610 family)